MCANVHIFVYFLLAFINVCLLINSHYEWGKQNINEVFIYNSPISKYITYFKVYLLASLIYLLIWLFVLLVFHWPFLYSFLFLVCMISVFPACHIIPDKESGYLSHYVGYVFILIIFLVSLLYGNFLSSPNLICQ